MEMIVGFVQSVSGAFAVACLMLGILAGLRCYYEQMTRLFAAAFFGMWACDLVRSHGLAILNVYLLGGVLCLLAVWALRRHPPDDYHEERLIAASHISAEARETTTLRKAVQRFRLRRRVWRELRELRDMCCSDCHEAPMDSFRKMFDE